MVAHVSSPEIADADVAKGQRAVFLGKGSKQSEAAQDSTAQARRVGICSQLAAIVEGLATSLSARSSTWRPLRGESVSFQHVEDPL